MLQGLSAFALEQSDAEQQRTIRWAAQWSTVRARAKAIVTSQTSNAEKESLPELEVEILDDDDDEGEIEEEGGEDV